MSMQACVMKRSLLFFLFFAVFLSGKAQFYYPIQQDAIDFSKRKLLVQILEEDDKAHKRLKEKNNHDKVEWEKDVVDYKKLIVQHNEWLKMAVSKYWKLNKFIEFKTQTEINEILNNPKTMREYAVLNTGWRNEYRYKNNLATPEEVYTFVVYVAEATDRHLPDLKRGPTHKMDYIFKVAFPSDVLNMSDFIFAVQQFNFHISNATVEGHTLERYRTLTHIPPFNKLGYELIKKKTLLIPEEIIEKGKEEELKLAYGYHFEIAGSKLYEEAVEQQFAKYIYFTLAWSDRQNNFVYYVVNASEGIILAELGHISPTLQFEHHALDNESTNTASGQKTAGTYKSKIGLSMNTIIQLEHLIGPAK